jgi:hypothetical protein
VVWRAGTTRIGLKVGVADSVAVSEADRENDMDHDLLHVRDGDVLNVNDTDDDSLGMANVST